MKKQKRFDWFNLYFVFMENSIEYILEYIQSFEEKAKKQVEKKLKNFDWFVLIKKMRSGDEIYFKALKDISLPKHEAIMAMKKKYKKWLYYVCNI